MVEGYCLKEKKKAEIKNPSFELNKKGRPIVRGECSSCGGTIYKILAAAEVPAELKAKMPKKGGAISRSRKSKSSRRSHKSRKSKSSRRSHKSRKSRGSKKSRGSRKSRGSKKSHKRRASRRSRK